MRVDGILLSLSNQTKDLEHLDVCKKMHIPLVLFDNTLETQDFASVHIDDVAAAAQCASYINEKQCKEVVAIYGPAELSISKNRRAGFTAQLSSKIKNLDFFASNAQEAYQIAMTQLQRNQHIAFFGISDEVLLGIVTAIKEQDLTNNTVVVGFSDGLTLPFLHKELNYIFHDGKIVGSTAAEQILKCIDQVEMQLHLEIPVELY
jgi:LacI family transcriptional regulator